MIAIKIFDKWYKTQGVREGYATLDHSVLYADVVVCTDSGRILKNRDNKFTLGDLEALQMKWWLEQTELEMVGVSEAKEIFHAGHAELMRLEKELIKAERWA